jgi:endo-1,3(4)-beta-glucanase
MIPSTPITEEVRLQKFVEEEWSTILSKIVDGVTGGWKGLLYTSYANINRDAAFGQLLNVPLDDGLSRSWALVSIINLLLLFSFLCTTLF